MLVHGSAAERTRGLDLGADDALSLPLDPAELLSRIRSQLRNKQIADELWERLRLTEEHENTNHQVVTAVNEERRTFLVGATAVVLVLIIVGVVSLSFYRRSHAENVRVYAAITRPQTGALSQQGLKQVMGELARHHLIKPVVTQGHIGEVLPDKIVYDAQTTSGGSRGPLFNDQGQVIG